MVEERKRPLVLGWNRPRGKDLVLLLKTSTLPGGRNADEADSVQGKSYPTSGDPRKESRTGERKPLLRGEKGAQSCVFASDQLGMALYPLSRRGKRGGLVAGGSKRSGRFWAKKAPLVGGGGQEKIGHG